MPLKVTPSLHTSKNAFPNTMLQTEILAVLREDDASAHSAPEIAAAMRARSGVPENLRQVLALLGLFSKDLAELNADLRNEFEVAVNALLQSGQIKAHVSQGVTYFSASK